MQPWIKPFAPHGHTVRTRPLPGPPIARGCGWPDVAVAKSEHDEKSATSKLERLAAELRALGIQF